MTILNSYSIENYLYKIGDTLKLGNKTIKIETIMNVNGDVFFFCSNLQGHFPMRISETVTVFANISPMHALSFHHNALLSLTNTE